eukprot:615462_1
MPCHRNCLMEWKVSRIRNAHLMPVSNPIPTYLDADESFNTQRCLRWILHLHFNVSGSHFIWCVHIEKQISKNIHHIHMECIHWFLRNPTLMMRQYENIWYRNCCCIRTNSE